MLLVAPVPAASADERAFTLLGSEPFPSDSGPPSLPRTGSDVATDLSRDVADLAATGDGGVAVLSLGGGVDVIRADGRLQRLGRVAEGTAIDGAPDGSVLVASGRVWRLAPGGVPAAVTRRPTGDRSVLAVAALPDGGFVYAIGDFTTLALMRVAPDGSEQRIAGNGEAGRPRPGPALSSPLPDELRLDVTPAGEVLLAAGDAGAWVLGADGMLRALGGAKGNARVPPSGAPLASSNLGTVEDVSGDPASEMVILDGSGRMWTVRDGMLSRRTADHRTGAPLWAGALSSNAYLDTPDAVDRTSDGDVLFTTGDGVGLLTTPRLDARRLAVAIAPEALVAVRRGHVPVVATRRSAVELRAMQRGREILRVQATVEAGATTLALPRNLPSGVVRLFLRAADERGAVATHRFSVLGTPELPVRVARRMLLNYGDDFATAASVRRCRRRSSTSVNCLLIVYSEGGNTRNRATVTLRPDGWLWVRFKRSTSRVQLF